MRQDTAPLEEIARQIIDLQHTEMLVLTVPASIDYGGLERLRKDLTQLVPEDRRNHVAVVVLTQGMGLSALTEDQLTRLGYQRVPR